MGFTRGIEFTSEVDQEFEKILTPDAVNFVANLHREFNGRRRKLLARRDERQTQFDAGKLPDFLKHTADIRKDDEWRISPLPKLFWDLGAEITGPASSRSMMVNAFNSGAEIYMADSEDSDAPTWKNMLNGQLNLYDAVRREIDFETPKKKYQLNEKIAALFYRPRGWHLEEAHMLVDGERVSASLFDFGLYFFHNAQILFWHADGPNFYLPKIESRLEARLWNDVLSWSEDALKLPRNLTRAVVLIETLPAAFEMDEILFELRTRSAGLNCGRWDYIFSYIKKLNSCPGFVLPDRSELTMDKPFLANYANLLVQTCNRRGAPAIGGMSAYIPIKDNPEANTKALEKIVADKELERSRGFLRAWAAHPGLVAPIQEVMRKELADPEQNRQPYKFVASDLLYAPGGQRTEEGLRSNIRVFLQYVRSWFKGVGCVPIHNLMEDAATAEISRALIQSWIRHECSLTNGRRVDWTYVSALIAQEENGLKFGSNLIDLYTVGLFNKSINAGKFLDFLTIPGYETLLDLHRQVPSPEFYGSPT